MEPKNPPEVGTIERYECDDCGYVTHREDHFVRHKNIKEDCKRRKGIDGRSDKSRAKGDGLAVGSKRKTMPEPAGVVTAPRRAKVVTMPFDVHITQAPAAVAKAPAAKAPAAKGGTNGKRAELEQCAVWIPRCHGQVNLLRIRIRFLSSETFSVLKPRLWAWGVVVIIHYGTV